MVVPKDRDVAREAVAPASGASAKSVDAFEPWGIPDYIIEKVSRLSVTGLTRLNFGFGRGSRTWRSSSSSARRYHHIFEPAGGNVIS